jgi:MurNAc alpha-1-phosphate uridylyltransferase
VTLADDHLGHLVMVPTPDYRDHGDFDLIDGLVRNSQNSMYTFSGVAIYRPEFFADCEEGHFPLAPMLREAADGGRLSGSLYNGLWADIGTPERLAALGRDA